MQLNLEKKETNADYSKRVMASNKRVILKSQMIKGNLIFLALIAVLLSSCKSTSFYQIYKVNAVDDVFKSKNSLIYEDDNCKVSYDFWAEGGNVGFMIYNKTNKNIYVNKKESFFICNGIAYDYFRNRTYTDSRSSSLISATSNSISLWDAKGASVSKAISGYNYLGAKQTNGIAIGIASALGLSSTKTKGVTTSSGSSISFKEDEIICIPSNSAKVIAEYNITESLYRDCNLYQYPAKRQIATSKFTEDKSPFVFSNKITYYTDGSKTLINFENKFYVSAITNYPEKDVIMEKRAEFCGEKSSEKYRFFKDIAPDKFYIQYTKTQTKFKH